MKFLNTVEADTQQKKYFAALNAQQQNLCNRSHFSPQAQLIMERAEIMLSMLHFDSKSRINYRKTLASIKIFNTNIRNKRQYREYVEHLVSQGFQVKHTRQGIVYSISKTHLPQAA